MRNDSFIRIHFLLLSIHAMGCERVGSKHPNRLASDWSPHHSLHQPSSTVSSLIDTYKGVSLGHFRWQFKIKHLLMYDFVKGHKGEYT